MKQQQLMFDKGITNVPSDSLCSDNALEYAKGMIYRDGEHHVVQKPKQTISASYDLVYVHKLGNGTEKYIYEGTNNGNKYLYFGTNTGSNYIPGSFHTGETIKSITSIGNTLIVSFSGRICRLLYKGTSYLDISNIPEPNVNFYLSQDIDSDRSERGYSLVKNSQNSDGILHDTALVVGAQDKYNAMVVGLYAKNLKQIAQKKGFAEPFAARVALELYDGSYMFITNPVLLFPTVTMNSHGQDINQDFKLRTRFSQLYCRQSTPYTKYGDIVKDVVLFVSDGVPIYDTSVDQPYEEYVYNQQHDVYITDGIAYNSTDGKSVYYRTKVDDNTEGSRRWSVLAKRSEQEIAENIQGISIFYRLCSLGLEDTGWINTASRIDTHTLENLTTQEQLKNDDYLSRNELKADFLYVYNSRLNMGIVRRGLFGGFQHFLPYDHSNSDWYTAFVKIDTGEGEKWVSKTYRTTENQGIYYYYPDSRARYVIIKNTTTGKTVCNQALKEHPSLNGAYFFRGLPGASIQGETQDSSVSDPETSNGFEESLYGYILTSEVNNPFVFKAEGYNRVGTGKVVGMAAQTQALSQGQFGQYPLIVFTTDGIWAMNLDSTGLFTSISPMSREVALETNPAITQVDGAIFFISKKGLMLISGSQVKCVSEQLNGKTASGQITFNTHFATCKIAYDYRDSLLLIINNVMSAGHKVLIYSMKSGAFSYADDMSIANVVSNYPDTLLQDNSNNKYIYTLYNRDDINTEAAATSPAVTYSAELKTRPMKLENALALKTILQMRHIRDMNSSATLAVELYASNNLTTWIKLTSLRGKPWKYYRLQYTFTNLKATDTFAGTVLVTEERRTDKLR